MNKRNVLTIMALCLVSSLITGIVVYAYTPGAIQVLSGGPALDSAYTIWTDSGITYAKNSNGQTEFSGTDPQDVLTDCKEALETTLIADTPTRYRCSGTIHIINDLTLTGAVDLTSVEGLTISGDGRERSVRIFIENNLDMTFDLTNSRFLEFKNLDFVVSVGYTPETVFYLARDTTGASVGDSIFDCCSFWDLGGVQTAFIYNFASELLDFRSCTFRPLGPALYLTPDNGEGIDSTFSTQYASSSSISQNRFFMCNFLFEDIATYGIILDHGCTHISFSFSYFGGATANYAMYFNTSTASIYMVSVEDCHIEMLHLATCNSASSGKGVYNFRCIGNTINPSGSGNYTFIDFDKTNMIAHGTVFKENTNMRSGLLLYLNATYWDYCNIDFRGTVIIGLFLYASNSIRYGQITVASSSYILADTAITNVDGWYYVGGTTF